MLFDVPFPGLREKKAGPESTGENPPATAEAGAANDQQQQEQQQQMSIDQRQAQLMERPIFGIVKHYSPSWYCKKRD